MTSFSAAGFPFYKALRLISKIPVLIQTQLMLAEVIVIIIMARFREPEFICKAGMKMIRR